MKIQNKRSGVAGKAPTPDQTLEGELCINFHESDPALYIKDSNRVIRRVGADVENYYTKEEIEGLDWDTSVADGRYLRIDADAPDQTRVAGKATFAEVTTHLGGVTVTGSTLGSLTGPNDPSLPQVMGIDLAGGQRIDIRPRGANSTDNIVELQLNPPQANGAGGGATIKHDKNRTDTQGNVLKITGNWTGDYTTTGGSQFAYNAYALVQADITGATTSAAKPITGFGVGTRMAAGKHWCAFRSTGLVSGDTAGESFIGFSSEVQANAATEAYNFYASGDAPSFLRGSIYIGGNTTDLGDNTNINLNSNGIIQGGGLEFTKNKISANVHSRGVVYSSTKKALLSTNRPNAAGDNIDIFLARTDNTSYDADDNRTAVNVGKATSFKAESPLGNNAGEYGTYQSYVGFHATNNGTDAGKNAVWTGDQDCYGFLSGLADRTVDTGQTYNFYAEGNAPNFLQGSTYIGGNTSRNTFDLWKSTLTEEQLEQLEAGTFAVPANVSLPGDGEFARQWWYDQQSAEDQAAIDAGEINYPEHLAAATFTDTFALGDKTKINLKNDGNAKFSEDVTAKGYVQRWQSSFTQVTNVNQSASLGLRMGSASGSGIGIRSVNSGSTASGLNTNCPRLVFNRCTDPNGVQLNENNVLIKTDLVPCNVGATLGELNWSTSEGSTDLYLARFTAYKRAKGGELELSLYNTDTKADYQYYFDPEGFFGFRFDGNNEFVINVNQTSQKTVLRTTKPAFRFDSAAGMYEYATPSFSSSLTLQVDSDFVGFTSNVSTEAGKYGIKHVGNRVIAFVNSSGELRLTGNGNGQFIKGSDIVTITPGGTNPGTSAGSINAKASSATTADSATTAVSADKVSFTTFNAANTRPIACFGSNSTVPASGTSVLRYAEANYPTIRGDGRLTVPDRLLTPVIKGGDNGNSLEIAGLGITNGRTLDSATSSSSAMQFKSGNAKYNFLKTDGTTGYQIDATAGTGSFILPEDAAEPTNYDAEGEYIGPVQDRVADLIARIAALESNEIIDDAVDSSLLQLVASANTRLDAIEARLAALEGA